MGDFVYNKEYPSNPEVLPEIENYILEIAQKHNMSDDNLNLLALSVSEASSNSIIHGNKSDPTKIVKLEILVADNSFLVKFLDQGEGFDPNAVPDPTVPENLLKDHGRGIHIMKSYLNRLKYNFTPNGTETILELELK
ncbi:MAG: hypothetical protein SCALA702_08150 [Melioribacteraceae bacterium]|nr:MAG: hypothetical protein SCALA702_08150 [Melioribacteraceae bacterium]